MLPPETQEHIYDVIPRDLTIDWNQPTTSGSQTYTTTLDVTVRERAQVDEPRPLCPLVVVDFGPTTVSWEPGKRLPETHKKEDVPDDPTVAYREHVGEDVYDKLTIIVAVADGRDVTGDGRTDIPKKVVADELAREVYASYLLGTDYLNDEQYMTGEYEWPVKIVEETGAGIERIPDLWDDQTVVQYAMQFNCHYTIAESREVPATHAIGYTTELQDPAESVLATASGTLDLIHGYGVGGHGVGEHGW